MDCGDAEAIRGSAAGGRGHGGAENTEARPALAPNGFSVARHAHAWVSSGFATALLGVQCPLGFPGEHDKARRGGGSYRQAALPDATRIRTQARSSDPQRVLQAEEISLRNQETAFFFFFFIAIPV